MDRFDWVIIGSGPAGYETALGLSKQGQSVAIVEKDELGGVCLNRGCIPTKVMASAAKRLEEAGDGRRYGISREESSFSPAALTKYRNNVVTRLRKGLEQRLSAAGITIYRGTASLVDTGVVEITPETTDAPFSVTFDNLVIAAGSKPAIPPAWSGIDNVVDSECFWEIEEPPKNILIVGGGVIGCEFASSLAVLGYDVTIMESENRVLTTEEPEVSEFILRQLKKRRVSVLTDTTIVGIRTRKNCLEVSAGGTTLKPALVVCCMGRKTEPETLGPGASGLDIPRSTGLQLREHTWIAGDIAPGPQLAHKAAYDARIIVDRVAGRQTQLHYDNIPLAVFTSPEVGRAGLTESQAAQLCKVESRRVDFAEMGKAIADNRPRGFLKIIIRGDTREIAGMTIVGHDASEFSNLASLILANKMTVDDLRRTVFSHPTLGEIFHECADRF
ncbi:MAG TPA: NAD(P)/FAD-dependent oxidoreductase [Deltaproteobacteria bacterium]|nr:NAD(P)/FAD-dependent oxidoreductase [Deltaproteobacteria bacterium]